MKGIDATLPRPARWSRVGPTVATVVALGATLALWTTPVVAQDETPATGYPTDFGPTVLAVDAEGRLYASDCGAARVYRIEPDGVSVVIGSGPGGFGAGFKGDRGPATEAETLCPYGIAFDPDGRLLLVDHGNNRVRRVDEAGIISTIAGSGPGKFQGGFAGDGGPAVEGMMQEPTAVAVDAEGDIYVSDRENHRVRRIATNGVITTVAGNGDPTFSLSAGPGDGGLATAVGLNPQGLAVDAEGSLYVSSPADHRVFRVAPEGTITTFAGTGKVGSDGDGGQATEATLTSPDSLMLDGAGNLYVGDYGANRIRTVSPDGTITTFAGTGEQGYGGDGGPATEATLRLGNDPASIAIDAAGNVYIGDSRNHVIRIVDPSGVISTLEVGS